MQRDRTEKEAEKEREKDMRLNSLLRSPKKEEQQVPDAIFSKLSDDSNNEDLDTILDELNDAVLGTKHSHDDAQLPLLNWDFMEWERDGLTSSAIDTEEAELEEEEEDDEDKKPDEDDDVGKTTMMIKREIVGFWEDDEKNKSIVSLNLNLNYQEVLDAWSDRGSLWAEDYSLSNSMPSNSSGYYYMGEVPILEEERTRREASVLRYKEKRQSRLFSKKIRYQVRKLNADKRPRIKGRFVKRL
ncbi:protein CHLOROPLAST IMPORT APPARATUS 2 [Senna tora]|uniref:Protein CHLOROPLAST IMPORT APPARATUS 2 n=1 Tax=Senna tora TaxID=362788 RepID=A0A834T4X8_9FABA|nr:protein CHLOROPLAST IMPORT APPARATUS 2 [Senna tora]